MGTGVWESEYDYWGNLLKLTEPKVGGGRVSETLYGYNGLDQLVEVDQHDLHPRQGDGHRLRSFVYDSLGRLRRAVEPENGTTLYQDYDARGNLRRWRDQQQTTFLAGFDAAGRPLNTRLKRGENEITVAERVYGPAGSGTETGRVVNRRSYTSHGEPVLEERFQYEPWQPSDPQQRSGRLNTRRWCFGNEGCAAPELDLSSTFSWNRQGLLKTVSYPSETGGPPRRSLTTGYKRGLLVSLADGDRSYLTDLDYTATLTPARLAYGNGVISSFLPDSRNRVRTLEHKLGQTSLFPERTYGYDKFGHLLTVSWAPPGSGPQVDSYDYDLLGRLSGADFHDQDGPSHNAEFAYDAFGNLWTYRHDGEAMLEPAGYPKNRLSTGPGLPAYDSNGNLIQDERFSYDYDERNMLSAVRPAGAPGEPLESYVYGDQGRRVRVITADQTTWYLRDAAGRVLSEYESHPECGIRWTRDYVHAHGRSVALVDKSLAAVEAVQTRSGDGEVAVLWSPQTEATGYWIYRGSTADPATLTRLVRLDECAQSPAPGMCEYTDTNVVNGTSYYYSEAVSSATGLVRFGVGTCIRSPASGPCTWAWICSRGPVAGQMP